MNDGEFLVFIYNQDGGEPVTRHKSLDAAKAFIRSYIADADNDPHPTAELISRVDSDLSDIRGWSPCFLHGEMAWSETIWIIPVPYCEIGQPINLEAPGVAL